jgi:CDP-diacylglycerol--glycerol-3-phosphate 3-phosphatidyltransferase
MRLLTAGFYDYAERWNKDARLLPHDRFLNATLLRLLPKSVLPNHLTLARLVMIPLVLAFLAMELYWVGVPLFLLAGLTDALDGSLARVRRRITRWGIIFDPLADKLLVGAVVALVVIQRVNLYLGVAILAVEAMMVIGGFWRVRQGRVQQANAWGKLKMIFEVFGLTLLLLAVWFKIDMLIEVSIDTLVLALIFAIVSVLARIK